MRRVAMALAAVALVATACGAGPSGSTRPTPSSSTGPPASSTTTTTTRPSALGDLAPYFADAVLLDHKLKAAARAVDGAVGSHDITVDASTRAAIGAADPASAARLIPAGLSPPVLLTVLTVQSDLVSRYFAMRGFLSPGAPATIPIASDAGSYALTCLGSGTQAASLFPTDLAAAETSAATAPPAVAVDPSSHTAADLAIWLHQIEGQNSGCQNCGGARFTTLDPITWHAVAPLTPGGTSWDGDVGGGLFTARYSAGQGWTIETNAC